MNMKQLKYVQILAEEGSFARAAASLGISQPSLSQYIKKIEKEMGLELFDRSGSNVRLTDAGRVYVEVGGQILDLEHQMQNKFADIAENKTGSVIVGTSPYRSAGMMPSVVKAFRKEYPGMHVVVEEMTSAELEDAAEHGKFDICLTLMPVDRKLFNIAKVTEEELIMAVPADYPELKSEIVEGKKHPAIDVDQIDGRSFIMITESQAMQRTFDRMCSERGLTIEKAAVVKSLEAQISMVRAGAGVALVPSGIETFCTDNEVRFYSFKQDFPKREVIAMWRKDRTLNQAARSLLDIMKETLNK